MELHNRPTPATVEEPQYFDQSEQGGTTLITANHSDPQPDYSGDLDPLSHIDQPEVFASEGVVDETPEHSLPREEPITINERGEVMQGGNVVASLSPREAQVFGLLLHEKGALLRADIYQKVWGITDESGQNAVDVTISRIKKKLPPALSSNLIRSGVGFGYLPEVDPEDRFNMGATYVDTVTGAIIDQNTNQSVGTLARTHLQILNLLGSKPGEVVTIPEIINVLYPNNTLDDYIVTSSAQVDICRLREKLKIDKSIDIETVSGKGYRLVHREQSAQPSGKPIATEACEDKGKTYVDTVTGAIIDKKTNQPVGALASIDLQILNLLGSKPGEAVTVQEIINAIYPHKPLDDNTITRMRRDIFYLRTKLKIDKSIHIETIIGKGYRLVYKEQNA